MNADVTFDVPFSPHAGGASIYTFYWPVECGASRTQLKNWALVAGILIGPLALPLLFLLPNLHDNNGATVKARTPIASAVAA